MDPIKQQVALAKVSEWTDIVIEPPMGIDPWGRSYERVNLPDYLNDLNAVHELEKSLTEEQCMKYHNMLKTIISADDPGSLGFIWGATAAQRCEAILRVLNLWEE